MIPRLLHVIWIGDEAKRPDNCIRTWVQNHPQWTVKLWGNAALSQSQWINAPHMREMSTRELCGVADMMRWEILYGEGGVFVDADTISVRPLDEALLECEAFTSWESEMARPGLLATTVMGSQPRNPFIGQIVNDIHEEKSVAHDRAWRTVGPQRLTLAYRKYQYHGLRIYPSHYFMPEHFTGIVYNGNGPVYSRHEWASTRNTYDQLHLKRWDGA